MNLLKFVHHNWRYPKISLPCHSTEVSHASWHTSASLPVAILYPFGGAFVVAGFPEGIAARLQKLIVAVMWHCCEAYVGSDGEGDDGPPVKY